MNTAIFESVRTLSEANALKEKLAKDSKRLYKTSPHVSNPGKVQKLLNNLTAELNSLPIVKLELAYEPTSNSIKTISNWLNLNSPWPKILFDFTVNDFLIGGAKVYFRGKTGDYSLRKKYESI